MREYHKIQTVFKRDPTTKHKTLIEGEYSEPAFEYLANNKWMFTEKVDGTNIRVIIPKNSRPVHFGGKTDTAQIPAKLITRLQEIFINIEMDAKLCAMFPNGACLYGEGYGAGIQSGGNYLPHQDFILFDVLVTSSNGKEWWLEHENVLDIAKKLDLQVVPTINYGTLHDMVEMAREGFKSIWSHNNKEFTAEGIVARPMTELKTRAGDRVITKIKHKDFTKKV